MENVPALTAEQWQRLQAARDAYDGAVSTFYDEVLQEVIQRAHASESIGKADIGALLMWKRLRADTRWVSELMALPETKVRKTTAVAVRAVRDASISRAVAAKEGRAALAELPGLRHGDALAFALLTAEAPDRMAIYDRRAHSALHALDLTLSNTPGRYSRYMNLLDGLLTTGPHTLMDRPRPGHLPLLAEQHPDTNPMSSGCCVLRQGFSSSPCAYGFRAARFLRGAAER